MVNATSVKESEAKFRVIFESSRDAIMLLDQKGFFDCNPATLEMFGLASKDEFIVLHPAELSLQQIERVSQGVER